ncbi:MAG: protease modulator HflC [Calditrichaceae bacterium]|nr:protease modulator HflC [Calditrichaceae bacterium]MBN2710166.1 protease modulator HflC [Calditrichaceae bacterium]RQV94142.1 MAG: protease modulator HflC [Calditrichota bacterium]
MKKSVIIGIVVIFVFLGLLASAYTVDETEQVIITMFKEPQRVITDPGLHFKIPFFEQVVVFEKRFLEWDGDADEIPISDKQYIFVDIYARWRISDVFLYFQRFQSEARAQSRLDDILDGETRNAVAKHKLAEIIRSTNRILSVKPDSLLKDDMDANLYPEIAIGRSQITRDILAATQARVKDLGIEILDLQFKRINYRESVRQKVYDRMISERKRIADKFRSEGQGEASKILGDKERELKSIQSDAYRQAQEIIGKADAEATTIYARAYDRSADTRDFYRFLKTLESYKNTLSEKDILILSTKSDFFRYLESESGR